MINVTNQLNKPFGNRFGSPGVFNQKDRTTKEKNTGVKFIGDLKKHGIYEAFNEINKLSEFFEALPNTKSDDIKDDTIKAHDKSESYNQFTESGSTQMMSSSAFMETKEHNTLGSAKQEDHKTRFEKQEKGKKLHFLFPFQRRASSHSPTSEEQIHNKIAEAISNNKKHSNERSWSKSQENNIKNYKNSSPVVANTSFIIGNADLYKSKKLGERRKGIITKEEKKMMEGKEVEDWLSNNISPQFYHNDGGLLPKDLDFDEFLDDQEIVSRVSNTFGKNRISQRDPKAAEVVVKTDGDDPNQWMYQTVGSFNNTSKERNDNSCEKENISPNIYKQMHLSDKHLDEFMKKENILQEDTFSIEAKENCDYDDLETYVLR